MDSNEFLTQAAKIYTVSDKEEVNRRTVLEITVSGPFNPTLSFPPFWKNPRVQTTCLI